MNEPDQRGDPGAVPAGRAAPAGPQAPANRQARADPQVPADPQARVLTIPNAISVARLLGVPVFLWLVLGPKADWWAVALLIVAGLSDWLDGKLARAWNQQSRLGQVLDPAADRLYIAATLIGLAIRGIIPWWLVALLAARELVLGVALLVLRRHSYGPLQVSLVGKAATLCLLYAFPLLFIGEHAGPVPLIARVAGWAFAIWGSALYWWAAGLYLVQTRQLVAAAGRASIPGQDGPTVKQDTALAQRRPPSDDGA
jgi:cardiolipin synthase (CMP-forming)